MLHQGITIRLRHRSYRIVDRRHARWPDWPAHTASRRPNRALLEAITADPANSIPLRSVLASCGDHHRDWHHYHPTQKEIVRQLTDLLVAGRITIVPVLAAPAPLPAANSPATPASSQTGGRLSTLARSRPAPAQPNVAQMSTEEKMEFAIRSAPLARGMLRELGDIKLLVASFVVVAAAMAAIAATGIGALVEGVTVCLLIVGAATAGVQIGRGINKLIEFYQKVRRARNEADLRDAGISFADGVASLGVGAFLLLLSFLGARSRVSGRYWNAEESTGAQAARPGRSLKSGTGAAEAETADNLTSLRTFNYGGRQAQRILPGASDKVAVIGQGMGSAEVPGVRQYGAALRDQGYDVSLFDGDAISADAKAEWNMLTAGGRRLSDAELLQTKMYQENLAWAQKVKADGSTIVDLGSGGSAGKSVFYDMETSVFFGGGR